MTAAGEQAFDAVSKPSGCVSKRVGPVLLFLSLIVAGLYVDARGLLAASRYLSCAALSFRDSEPLAHRPSLRASETLKSQDSPGFDVALTSIRLPCSRFFRVAPTVCTLALDLRSKSASRLEAPILLSDIQPSSSVRATRGELCDAATIDARTTIPVWWIPALLRASINGAAGADLPVDSVDVADSVSVACHYSVALCVFGDALCLSAYHGELESSVFISSLMPSTTASSSTVSSALAGSESSNPIRRAAEEEATASASDAPTRAPALTIPMSASAASAFSVTETVDIDVAGVDLGLEACVDCSVVSDSYGPSLWAPLYTLVVGGVHTHCSKEMLDGTPCVVSLDVVRSLQHTLPASLISSIGSIALSALVSELVSLPAPLKRMVLSALSMHESSAPGGELHAPASGLPTPATVTPYCRRRWSSHRHQSSRSLPHQCLDSHVLECLGHRGDWLRTLPCR